MGMPNSGLMTTTTTSILTAAAAGLLAACQVTSHQATPVSLGRASSGAALDAALVAEGPTVTVERVVAADWAVPLSGLLDLDDPKARAAGLEDREEAIQIYMYVIRHPEHGTVVVDSGVARAVKDGTSEVIGWAVRQAMNIEKLEVRTDTKRWLEDEAEPVRGVFLTHLHLDHILGVADFPADTPVYVGPGEAEASRALNMFVQDTTDRALEGHTLRSLRMPADPDGRFAAVLDVFGDGSFFALLVPGHTHGHLAFAARTPEGPVLMTGDASHTTWGFQHGVQPGSYTEDPEHGAEALASLRDLARRHPQMEVCPGHQRFTLGRRAWALAD